MHIVRVVLEGASALLVVSTVLTRYWQLYIRVSNDLLDLEERRDDRAIHPSYDTGAVDPRAARRRRRRAERGRRGAR